MREVRLLDVAGVPHIGTPQGVRPLADWFAMVATGVPSGLICLWSGLLAAVPAGWRLCDGTNGTPDLRERFVKGAAAGVDPGATGGALTHLHATHSSLTHSGAAVDDHASHTHDVTTDLSTPKFFAPDLVLGKSGRTGGPSAALTHAVAQAAAHTISVHDTVNHEPVWYALAYIQKT